MRRIYELAYIHFPSAVQNWLISYYGARARRERFSGNYAEVKAFFDEAEWWPLEKLRTYQDESVRRLVDHAYNTVPYYRKVMDQHGLKPHDIGGANDLVKIPTLKKKTVQTRVRDLVSQSVDRKNLTEAWSSGTTGPPTMVYWDRNIEIVNNAVHWRLLRWAGLEFGEPYGTLLGRVIVPAKHAKPPFWRVNRPWNQLILSSYHLKPENVRAYVEAIKSFRLKTIVAHPSAIYILAKLMEDAGLEHELASVFTSGEPTLDMHREAVRRSFGCDVFDAYGMAERVMASGECDRHEGHHVCMEFGVAEIVGDDGQRTEPGQIGKIVATSLHNWGMPLIRYEVGDASAAKAEPCSCGRGLELLSMPAVKLEDILVLPDGRMLAPVAFHARMDETFGVDKVQIVQEKIDSIVLKIVADPTGAAGEIEALVAEVKRRVGPEVNVRVEIVSSIPRHGLGKFRRVISTVPMPFTG